MRFNFLSFREIQVAKFVLRKKKDEWREQDSTRTGINVL